MRCCLELEINYGEKLTYCPLVLQASFVLLLYIINYYDKLKCKNTKCTQNMKHKL